MIKKIRKYLLNIMLKVLARDDISVVKNVDFEEGVALEIPIEGRFKLYVRENE